MAMPEENQDLLQEEGIQFHEIWELIKKRRMIVYYFAGFVLLAALIRVQLQTPMYRANGTLLIDKEGRNQLSMMNQYWAFDSDFRGEYLNTQIRILTSQSLAQKVVEELRRLPGNEKTEPKTRKSLFGGKEQELDPQEQKELQTDAEALAFLGGLGVSQIPDTRLLEVNYVSSDAKLAAHSVNTLFDKFIEFSLEMKAESTKKASEFLTTQIEEMRRALAQKEQELQEYGKRKELYYIRGSDSTVVQKLSDINTAFTQAQIERINREATYRELKGTAYDNYSEVRASSLVQNLKQEYSAKESEYKRKSQIFQDSYPEMQRLKSQLDGLQKRIGEETTDIARKVLNQAESEYQAALKKENYLQEMLDQQKGSVVSSNADAIYYNSLKIEVENMRVLLNFLISKQKESMLTSRLDGTETSNIKVVDRARVPQRPFSPNKQRTLLMALMLGIGGGIFLIFALNYLDNTVKSPEEVEKLLKLPALGYVPAVGVKAAQSYYNHYYSDRKKQQNEEKIKTIELVNLKDPESTFAEHYRNIRTSLLLSTPDKPPRVFVATSALPQEGKTVTAVNLAVAFAQLGKKVLILDADLRRPRVHKIFRVKNTAGISSFLSGRGRIEEIIHRYPAEPNLHVLPSGPIPPNPVEMIISKGMREMIVALRQHYDFIFIDAPPLMGIQDAILLGEHADGLLLVAWGGKTPRKVVEKARDTIEKFNIKLFGVILNKVNMRRFSYAYSSYSYKYGEYRNEEEGEGLIMIDLHGHYLPAVDDGAKDLETSLAMLRLAEADGIATVAVTPHACGAMCQIKDLDSLRRAWESWRKKVAKEDLKLNIVGGAEVYFTSELLKILKDNRDLLTINNSSYFLLEFPADYVYAHSTGFVFKAMTEDLIPIISHAERNQEIQRAPGVLRELVKAGALCQVNAGSLRGDFGARARDCAYALLRDNLVHVIASDAHDLDRRRPGLSYVRPLLTGIDPEKIELYLRGIPAAIIADEAIPDIGEPVSHHARRSFFDIFRKRDS